MAKDDLPDAPWIKGGDLPDTPWEKPDPGFWPGVGRVARGVATGIGKVGLEAASNLPGMPTFPVQEHATEALERDLPRPKDTLESVGVGAGEILPSFLIPELGLEGLAARGLSKARDIQSWYYPTSQTLARNIGKAQNIIRSGPARTASAALEGAGRGAIGGAMVPEDDRAENAGISAGAGAAVRGAGTGVQAAVNALPPRLKNTVSALAAVAAANKMGLPWWAAIMHGGWDPSGQYAGSLFQQLYRSNLADLAAHYFRTLTRVNPATVGATGVKLKEGVSGQ